MAFQSILWWKHPIARFELQSLYCNLLESVSLQRVERCPRKKILSCRWILHEIFNIDGMIGFITIISLFSIEFNVEIFNKTVGTVYISIVIISSDICTICQLVFFEIECYPCIVPVGRSYFTGIVNNKAKITLFGEHRFQRLC